MADIQWWSVSHTIPSDNGYGIPNDKGNWVTYADHLSAIAAARRENAYLPTVKAEFDRGCLQGERDGLKAARDAVDDAEILSAWKAVALAAIDGVKP